MKKTMFVLMMMVVIIFSCRKEKVENPVAQRCGWVTHKYYANPPGDTTLANRTYWLQWATDTTCPITNPNCGRYYEIQVPKSCWDTMLPPGSSGTRYCQ